VSVTDDETGLSAGLGRASGQEEEEEAE